jgi:hypothetical protein
MELQDASKSGAILYDDKGEAIVCPSCRETWLQEEEGEFTFGTCDHLRFRLHSECGEDFDFFGEWDSNGLLEMVEEALKKDEDADILDVLAEIQHPDVDKAILHIWWDDPLYRPWVLWGYQ